MPDLLCILNPRRISECLSAIHQLPIDKLWIRNMTEWEIACAWDEVLDKAQGYDRLIVMSDDGIVRRHALREVQRLLDHHPVVTGWSNLSAVDFRVNLSKEPLGELGEDAYTLYTMNEVMESESDTISTYLVAMCITGMSLDLWREMGFRTYLKEPPGNASDYCLSRDLHEAGVPMVAARDAFVWHVKQVWNYLDTDPRKRLHLEQPSEIVLERVERKQGVCLCR